MQRGGIEGRRDRLGIAFPVDGEPGGYVGDPHAKPDAVSAEGVADRAQHADRVGHFGNRCQQSHIALMPKVRRPWQNPHISTTTVR